MRFASALNLPLAFALYMSNSAHGFVTPSTTSASTRISRTSSLSFSRVPSSAASNSNSITQLYVSQIKTEEPKITLVDDSSVEPSSLEFNDLVKEDSDAEFKKGFSIIALITLFNASLSPIWHAVYEGNGPPPLFLNAVVSIVAFLGLVAGAPLLDGAVDKNSSLKDDISEKWSAKSFRGGMELGLWKGLGTSFGTIGVVVLG